MKSKREINKYYKYTKYTPKYYYNFAADAKDLSSYNHDLLDLFPALVLRAGFAF